MSSNCYIISATLSKTFRLYCTFYFICTSNIPINKSTLDLFFSCSNPCSRSCYIISILLNSWFSLYLSTFISSYSTNSFRFKGNSNLYIISLFILWSLILNYYNNITISSYKGIKLLKYNKKVYLYRNISFFYKVP